MKGYAYVEGSKLRFISSDDSLLCFFSKDKEYELCITEDTDEWYVYDDGGTPHYLDDWFIESAFEVV